MASTNNFKIYGDKGSGNCQKVQMTAELLGLNYEWIEIDIMNGESRTPDYLAKFPQGQVPGVELQGGDCLSQSNAIIRFLAHGSSLLPDNPLHQAKIDEWLFWEQYSHEPYIAVCRFHMLYLKKSKESRDPMRVERGENALDFMDTQLENRNWLVKDDMTIADISLYAYSHMAEEGGFDLSARPNVTTWIKRCAERLA